MLVKKDALRVEFAADGDGFAGRRVHSVEPFGRQEMQLALVHVRVELGEKSVRGA
jgi:hypothetical protein